MNSEVNQIIEFINNHLIDNQPYTYKQYDAILTTFMTK